MSPNTTCLAWLVFAAPLASALVTVKPVDIQPPAIDRVEAIAAMLQADEPVIEPISDRLFWDAAGKVPYLTDHIRRAEEAVRQGMISLEDWRGAYLAFSRTGSLAPWETVVSPFKESIRLLSIAEAVENKGRFIPPLEERIRRICTWPTWFGAAEDPDLSHFDGKKVQVDLGVAMLGADLASAMMLFGDRLDPEVRSLLRQNLRQRVLEPFRREVTGHQEPMFWLTRTNNWNAVCLCGIAVTALEAGDWPGETAWYLAASERLIVNSLAGFSSNGYCSEGLGYWSYGFGHNITMTEYIRRATGGKLDLFANPSAQTAGLFPFGIKIVDDVYPAFADCPVDVTPNKTWAWYVARRMGLDPSLGRLDLPPSEEAFFLYGRLLFIGKQSLPVVATGRVEFNSTRQEYPEAGVLVSRALGKNPFGMAVKAGNNGENHNHNDVGTYVVASNNRPILCDPGKEVYQRDTFSENRFKSYVHNSYGHPVPVVDGKLQETGADAFGKITAKHLEADRDTVLMDLQGAYRDGKLKALTRKICLDRKARTVTISDSVEFSSPASFATAMISYGQFELDGDMIRVTDGPASAVIEVHMQGAKPVYRIEELKANWDTATRGDANPRRLEIACDQPVTSAKIQCVAHLSPASE